MILIDLPQLKYLKVALKTWHRVFKPDGNLAVLTPSILLEKYGDRLTIEDFIEKYEHESIQKGEHINKELLVKQVQRHFKKLEEQSLVYMTVL